ncbi:MAG: IMS domain-containing protein [Oscillatoria sp. PMC 1051.18]|nr:IMS domain-containing protein [Oscillatoria sp. PMC 1050.18]MEC5032177.1 IMS domain-containing protein [Oscillatoria sp. PMC 1051.18]
MLDSILENRYLILRSLGSGGFGETFLAEDRHLPSARKCALKQLKPMTNNPQVFAIVQERFKREAVILEKLGEGNKQIPSLYAYLESEGEFFLVQEWIEGTTLTKKLQNEGILSESTVKGILTGILPVLDYVHSQQIVHRDIKPDNIILRFSDGMPVLIDFGAVKEAVGTIVTAEGNLQPSIVVGTPGFMPPEQAAGRPVYASDLYSLGLTAIYLLTGKIPQELPNDRATGEINWRSLAPTVTPNFAAVIDKAIASHPSDRYSRALEMLAALQPQSKGIPPTIPPETIAVSRSSPTLSPPSQPKSSNNHTANFPNWLKPAIVGSTIGILAVGAIAVIFFPDRTGVDNPNLVDPSETSSFTQEDAVNLINRWLEAKQLMFAPPYDRQVAAEITTGEQFEQTAGEDGSIEWLENNNAFYEYDVQRIDGVEGFTTDGDRAEITLKVTEQQTLRRNGRIDPARSGFGTVTVIYELEQVDGKWKIASSEIAE